MDSPNTSSSGADEDFNTRASPYFSSAPPPFNNNTTTTTTTMFDPLSSYFHQTIPNNPPPSLLNLDPPWSKSPASHNQNTPDLHPSTSSFQPFFTQAQHQHQHQHQHQPQPQPNHHFAFPTSSSPPAPHLPTTLSDNNTNPRASDNTRLAVRNPKKRSRASRRAPTTVLTTDTTNFRAMVQEFTGIPAPPFSSSPFPSSSRFDLFSNIRPNPLDSSFLLKPFPLKPHHQFSPLLNATISSTTTNTNNLLSDFTLPKPPSTLGMLNSFIHFDPKYPTQMDPTHKLNDFGFTHALPSLVSSDGAIQGNWDGGGGDNIHNLRGINGNFDYSSSKNTSTTAKVNYLASSSNFQEGNKGTTDQNISPRQPGGGEGMLESWICSSD